MATIDLTAGPSRDSIDPTSTSDVDDRIARGLLVLDEQRAHPRYFDGRFLAARDLTREQIYTLTRQRDLGRMRGSTGGVIRGLEVSRSGFDRVHVTAGHGLTGGGALVSLSRGVTIRLALVPEIEQLDLRMGVAAEPTDPGDHRSGVFVLALRPVEYAAHPVTRYPTVVHGQRGVEDGDIIEAVALTLYPFRDGDLSADPMLRRSELAERLFGTGAEGALPKDALPLAMLQLDAGIITWLDVHLVRRDAATEDTSVVGFGIAARALREAHILQYDDQLRELVAARHARGESRITAATYFKVLPPIGRMPASSIDLQHLVQYYFPAEMHVELVAVPADELPRLVEENLVLPPIDITGASEDLDHLRLQVLIPMSEEALAGLQLATVPRPRLAVPRLALSRLKVMAKAARDRLRVTSSAALPGEAVAALGDLPFRIPSGLDLADLLRPEDRASDLEAEVEPAVLAAWRRAVTSAFDQLLWYVRAEAVELRARVLFAPAVKEEKEGKEGKETKEGKEGKEGKETKEGKEGKETKEGKEKEKETKEGKEKESKEGKEKETKEGKEKEGKEGKEGKEKELKEKEKEDKELKEGKEGVKEKELKELKEKELIKDAKDSTKEVADKDPREKSPRENPKPIREMIDPTQPLVDKVTDGLLDRLRDRVLGDDLLSLRAGALPPTLLVRRMEDLRRTTETEPLRTFITPDERPAVGGRALDDEGDET